MEETSTDLNRIKEARHAAKALLKASKSEHAPVIIRDVCANVSPIFNLVVQGTDTLPSGVDAILHRSSDICIIGYDTRVAVARQRFSVAHELGHLHMGHVHGKSSIDLNSGDYDEVEANAFAAELLMPRTFLAADIKSGFKDVTALAKKYQVSEEAMWWRLSKCGLLGKL